MDLGSTYIFFDDYKNAKKVFINYLEKFKDQDDLFRGGIINIWIELAITNYLLGDYESALKSIEETLKLDSNHSIAIKLHEDIIKARDNTIKKDKSELYDYFKQEGRS